MRVYYLRNSLWNAVRSAFPRAECYRDREGSITYPLLLGKYSKIYELGAFFDIGWAPNLRDKSTFTVPVLHQLSFLTGEGSQSALRQPY